MDDDDWDIQAVVKGCAADHNTNVGIQEPYRKLCRDNPSRAQGVPPPVAQMTSGNGIGSSSSSPSSVHVLQAQSNRQRRRKNQQMKVVREMTQEQLSADSWAWRKYGQKPIKGSPYPRNYYRCSTSKSCTARKQVERSPNEAGLFLVSYTGEHTHPRPTHRSSLAGSTRAKSSTSTAAMSNGELSSRNKGLSIACSSSSPAGFSSRNEKVQDMQAEDDGSKSNDDHLKGGGSLFPMISPP